MRLPHAFDCQSRVAFCNDGRHPRAGYLNTTALSDLPFFAAGMYVAAGLFAFLAFQSGERAEDALKAVGGSVEAFFEAHEQAAIWALRSGILACVLAIVMELAYLKKLPWATYFRWALLIVGIHGSTVFATTESSYRGSRLIRKLLAARNLNDYLLAVPVGVEGNLGSPDLGLRERLLVFLCQISKCLFTPQEFL